jgi:ABC-type multidrug transport system ATPase subunit
VVDDPCELVADGVTLLLTTQHLQEADAVSDRVVLIDHGRSVASGTPAQLKAQVGEQRVDVIAADTEAFERLTALLGERFDVTGGARAAHDLDPCPR